MRFDLDAKSVKIKKILNKDFLELEVNAISTANPNRNGSHFTLEAMKQAIPTFYNKPILGSFSTSENDFRAHESNLEYDLDNDQMYYDYTYDTSEVPLGIIRQSDNIEIIHNEKDGLYWIKLTCAIWVKYNYKQVKTLLSSKKATKKISVEVEVEDSDYDENGIEHIKKFIFDGLTILGDKYETGIADAQMTILDMLDSESFQRKAKVLAFAYNGLSESPENYSQDSNKDAGNIENEFPEKEITMQENSEEGGNDKPMDNEKKLETEEVFAQDENRENPEKEEEACDCGNESNKEEEACGKACESAEGEKKEEEACDKACESAESKEEEACSCDGKEEEACDKACESAESKEEEACGCEDDKKEEEACDKATEACEGKEEEACGCEDDKKEEEACGCEENKETEACEKVAESAQFSATENVSTVEVDGVNVDINGLLEKYTALKEQFVALENQVKMQNAVSLIEVGRAFVESDSETIEDEVKAEFIKKIEDRCNNFELTTEEETKEFAKGMLAMYYYEHREETKKESKEFNFSIEGAQKENGASKKNALSELKEATKKLRYVND